ncbi:MAG: type II toxin-antitoxin system ParD family antitoxin [Tannerella sp.]|jgi:antitoxin ParD1/3/4|nr:type II toxin-antitoxin system ParD family antitoxin [Tannerella sp.]
MQKIMKLSLGTHYNEFMVAAVKSGRYSSINDVIRKSILLLEIEENKINVLRSRLTEGETSPMLNDFDAQGFLKQIHSKYL